MLSIDCARCTQTQQRSHISLLSAFWWELGNHMFHFLRLTSQRQSTTFLSLQPMELISTTTSCTKMLQESWFGGWSLMFKSIHDVIWWLLSVWVEFGGEGESGHIVGSMNAARLTDKLHVTYAHYFYVVIPNEELMCSCMCFWIAALYSPFLPPTRLFCAQYNWCLCENQFPSVTCSHWNSENAFSNHIPDVPVFFLLLWLCTCSIYACRLNVNECVAFNVTWHLVGNTFISFSHLFWPLGRKLIALILQQKTNRRFVSTPLPLKSLCKLLLFLLKGNLQISFSKYFGIYKIGLS